MHKINVFLGGNVIGSVIHSVAEAYLTLSTGWKVPIVKVDKTSHAYEVHIEPRHKNLHPSKW